LATSGSFDWNLTGAEIVSRALRIIGVVPQGDSPSATQSSEGLTALNSMIKSWQSDGANLWNIEWKTQSLTASSEVTGTDSAIYTCIKKHTGVAATNKPITGTNWTDFWIAGGATGGTWATSAYTAIGNISLTDTEILGVVEAFIRDTNINDSKIRLITREEYFDKSNKGDTGTPTELYFEKKLLTNEIYLDPQPDTSTDVLHYSAITRIEDFDSGTDDPEFDTKWIEPLAFNLAYKLSFEYSIALPERQFIRGEAAALKQAAMQDGNEKADMLVQPDLSQYFSSGHRS